MTIATIFFAPREVILLNLREESGVEKVRKAFESGIYVQSERSVYLDSFTGEDAAEEIFDLTNNPSRQEEREKRYGRGQSLSVGDIVNLGDEAFVCMSFGWAKL